jgi:two-component system sensor histidine kinase KdpD
LQRQFQRIGISILLISATTLAGFFIAKLGTTEIVMLYLLAVIATSYFLGYFAAIFAAIGSFLAINFFFIEPRYTFEVANPESWAALLGFLTVSVVVASLVKRLQNQTHQAENARRQAEFAREMAENLAALHDEGELLDAGCRLIHHATSQPTGIALPQMHGDGFSLACQYPAGAVKLDQRAAKWCSQNGQVIGPGSNNWPEYGAWVMPFGRMPGLSPVLVVMNGTAEQGEVTYLRGLLDQLAMAYQRVRNERRAKDAERIAQEESIQNALLASVSHDMRTPLTAILGATTTLLEQHEALSEIEQGRLLQSVAAEARYLANATENILSLTKLESSGNRDVVLDWQSPEEIVGAVLNRFRTRTLSHEIRSSVPQDIPLIRADAMLLSQALGNLIENALSVHHGSEPILVGAELRDSRVALYVKDRGGGFPQNFRAEDIRKFQRMNVHGKGMGLGLSIVQVIARLHKAELHIEQREGGGTCVALVFPEMPSGENLE